MEVHKTDSSDDEEMEDVGVGATAHGGNGGGGGGPLHMNNEPGFSSNESVSMDEARSEWKVNRMVIGGEASGSEEPFEMAPIPYENKSASTGDGNQKSDH